LESQKLEIAAWEQEYKKAAKKRGSAERPAKPESALAQPTLRRLVTSDATFESLHHVLSENPAGLFVIRDELTVAVRATPWVDGCSQAWVGYFAILAA
jgi:hypothetical protein